MRPSITLLPLLCLPGMIGCAGEPLETAEVEPSLQAPGEDPNLVSSSAFGPRSAQEQADLDQLAALEVFSVGAMLARYPAGALGCYGVCPGLEDEVAQANEVASERLALLSERAVAAVEASEAVEAAAYEQAAIEANLASLRALEVIEVGEFLAVVPQNNPSCYNLPCPEDSAAAELATRERAANLARIVDAL